MHRVIDIHPSVTEEHGVRCVYLQTRERPSLYIRARSLFPAESVQRTQWYCVRTTMSYYPSGLCVSFAPSLSSAPFADIIQHTVQRGPSPFYPRRLIVFHYIPFIYSSWLLVAPHSPVIGTTLQTSFPFFLFFSPPPLSLSCYARAETLPTSLGRGWKSHGTKFQIPLTNGYINFVSFSFTVPWRTDGSRCSMEF